MPNRNRGKKTKQPKGNGHTEDISAATSAISAKLHAAVRHERPTQRPKVQTLTEPPMPSCDELTPRADFVVL